MTTTQGRQLYKFEVAIETPLSVEDFLSAMEKIFYGQESGEDTLISGRAVDFFREDESLEGALMTALDELLGSGVELRVMSINDMDGKPFALPSSIKQRLELHRAVWQARDALVHLHSQSPQALEQLEQALKALALEDPDGLPERVVELFKVFEAGQSTTTTSG